jgi:hypothetical protein
MRNIKTVPKTIFAAPTVFFQVIFSWNNTKPAKAAKSGFFEEIGTACD